MTNKFWELVATALMVCALAGLAAGSEASSSAGAVGEDADVVTFAVASDPYASAGSLAEAWGPDTQTETTAYAENEKIEVDSGAYARGEDAFAGSNAIVDDSNGVDASVTDGSYDGGSFTANVWAYGEEKNRGLAVSLADASGNNPYAATRVHAAAPAVSTSSGARNDGDDALSTSFAVADEPSPVPD